MTSHGRKPPNYIAVWTWLLILTILEVLTAYAPRLFDRHDPQSLYGVAFRLSVSLLVGMALVKALLVALYFMHLRFERRTFIMVVSFPVVLAVFLVFMLLPDIGFKGG